MFVPVRMKWCQVEWSLMGLALENKHIYSESGMLTGFCKIGKEMAHQAPVVDISDGVG